MGKIVFNSNSEPTLGVELEFGLVRADTFDLSNSIQELLARLPSGCEQVVKPELMQCCVEINTDICRTVADVESDLSKKIAIVEQAADELELRLWWGGTHPFARAYDQRVTPTARYQKLVGLLQEMALRMVTFGLHIHVGVDSGDKVVMMCDRIMRHLPTLLAISASSPFWEGSNTGLNSYRSKVMEGLPTAGLPTLMRNWSEYSWLVNHMIRTGFINTIREIWWDVRPHHNFGTVEIRMCDMPGNLKDVLTITALVQSLVKSLSDDIDQGTYQHDCHPMLVRQNKWRACRYGLRAELVDSFTYQVHPAPAIVEQLVHDLRPTAESLGCWQYLERALDMVARPSWAERQLDILRDTGDPREIVRRLTAASRISPPVALAGQER